ncbi:MAG: FkbM family methyltransferase [Myxococcota bacterium]|nr:FkbM family methyltransferase [Myxococcota bacterium]
MTEENKPSSKHKNSLTLGVFFIVCALLFYVQKDVRAQMQKIEAELAAEQQQEQTTQKPTEQARSGIECPRSKFEGAGYYSQYYEDYILDFVFADVDKGTYIDVGAAEPKEMSLTHKFYQRGWRGINIDPMPSYVEMYKQERPDDLFLNIGISNEAGSLSFYDCGTGCGYSTFDGENLESIKKETGLVFVERKVPVITLKKVLQEHPQEQVHFVNVDVEGWEKQVIESFDFTLVRPEVFVVESTIPNTDTPNFDAWENILLENNYVLAMTDFLNRYYINAQSSGLVEYLRRFSYVDMCVRQSKIGNDVYPTTVGTLMNRRTPRVDRDEYDGGYCEWIVETKN